MNRKDAIQSVYDCLVGENSITVKLRMKKGLDREQFEIVKKSLEYLINDFSDTDLIPKILAYSLVDIGNNFQFSLNWYNKADLEEIEDAGNELIELAYKLFS